MPCCDTGRNIQKYKGAAASTLQDVTDNGNTTTGDIITTSGFFIGDGSKLTGISGASAAFTLQETSDRGNTTSNVIQFTNTFTSFTTSGNVIIGGNVTASNFYGDGTTLDGVALSTDLESNVGRIEVLESKTTAISYTNSTTTISSNLEINGNLSITGNTYIINSDTLVIEDRIIGIANNNTSHTLDVGIVMQHPDHNIAIIHHGSASENDPHEHVLTIGYTQNTVTDNHITDDTSNSITVEVLGNLIVQNNLTISEGSIYGPINGSNTITTSGVYGPINGSNTITTSGVYGPIKGSNTISASTISTTTGFYGPIKGSNTITTSGVYGPIKGSNTITTSGVYGPIKGSNTISASTISTTTGFYGPIKGSNTITGTLISDDASAINGLNASNVTTGTLPVDRGGTNITTYAKGDILIASATNTLSKLSLGTDGYVLTSNTTTSLPQWKSSSELGTQVAQLSNSSYILGGLYNGITARDWSVQASTSNTSNYIVARDTKGDIFVSNVNAIQYYGDGGTLSNIVGSQNLEEVIVENPYTNSPPYFGAGSYGAIYGSNTISASTISTTTGFYGPIKGSNTITTSGVYGPIKGSNTISASTISTTTGFYGPIKGSNTITGTTLNVNTLISDDASAINGLNASNINSGTLSNTYGGTGFTSYNQGDLLVGAGSGSNLRKLGVSQSTANYVLTVNGSGNDIGWQAASGGSGSIGTFQQVTDTGNTTSNTVQFQNSITSLTASGNVLVTGNVTASKFYGDGSGLTSLNATNINSGTLSNAYGGTGFTSYNQGDLLVGAGSGSNLRKLGVSQSTANYVLTVNGSGNDIGWQAASGGGSSLWTQTVNNDIYYNSGNVGISNSTTNHTVHLGSNVIINDTGNYDVFRVNGNVFTTGHFVGDGSYITGIKQIKNETDTDVIVAGDGAPTRRSLLSRFYN
jgi:hypothetical protein